MKKKPLFIAFILTIFLAPLIAEDQAHDKYFQRYLDLWKKEGTLLGPLGDSKKGEIEIVLTPKEIDLARETAYNKLTAKGVNPDSAHKWTRVGVIGSDNHWIWIRDAVKFPSGNYGLYNRLFQVASLESSGGVAILPVMPDGKIALILNYRHATRSWELELPRGYLEPRETVQAGAERELKEETGFSADKWIPLGRIATDTGVLNSVIPVLAAFVKNQGKASPDFSEAIDKVVFLSYNQLKKGFLEGGVEIQRGNTKIFVPLRDAFLTFALYKAELQGIIK